MVKVRGKVAVEILIRSRGDRRRYRGRVGGLKSRGAPAPAPVGCAPGCLGRVMGAKRGRARR
jgi:hypothetical protein